VAVSQQNEAQGLPENPLDPCRYPTNCVRESRAFGVDADRLFEAAERAARQTGGLTIGKMESIRPDPSARHFESTFRIFGFKDDLAVTVAPHAGGAVLHVRSASRTGRGDLGVNRRRVKAFFEEVAENLAG
jgi:uncharacterized protein (DUF1499 family)